MSNINTMIDRAGEILEYLYSCEAPVGVSKISADLDMPKATVFRILTTLEKWGIVSKESESDKYRLGLVLVKYASKVTSNLSLVTIAKPIIDALSAETGESINLSIEHFGHSLNIYRSTNENSILASRLVPVSPLNCSASGKLFLTTKSEQEIRAYFDSTDCSKRTVNSIVSYDGFLREKASILSNGIAYDNEEYEYGLSCISSPIRHREKIVAAVSVSGPKSRLELKGYEKIQSELKEACASITQMIQYLDIERLF